MYRRCGEGSYFAIAPAQGESGTLLGGEGSGEAQGSQRPCTSTLQALHWGYRSLPQLLPFQAQAGWRL